MASNHSRSWSANGCSARTRLPSQEAGSSMGPIRSRRRALSSTPARAFRYRSWAFCDTSARRCRSAIPLRMRSHASGASGSVSGRRSMVHWARSTLHYRRVGFVMEFEGVAVVSVFDPHAFLAPLPVAGHLSGHPARNFTGCREFLTPKPKHIRTAERGHGVMQPRQVHPRPPAWVLPRPARGANPVVDGCWPGSL